MNFKFSPLDNSGMKSHSCFTFKEKESFLLIQFSVKVSCPVVWQMVQPKIVMFMNCPFNIYPHLESWYGYVSLNIIKKWYTYLNFQKLRHSFERWLLSRILFLLNCFIMLILYLMQKFAKYIKNILKKIENKKNIVQKDWRGKGWKSSLHLIKKVTKKTCLYFDISLILSRYFFW